jgi:hypothetical protein
MSNCIHTSDCKCHEEKFKLIAKLNFALLKCKIYKQLLEKDQSFRLQDDTDQFVEEMMGEFTHVLKEKIPKTKNISKPLVILPLECEDKKREEIYAIFGENAVISDEQKQSTLSEIDKMMESLKEMRTYTQTLISIKNLRILLLSYLSPSAYIELLHHQKEKLKLILNDKNFTDKKWSSIYLIFFSPLECRLLQLDGYHKLTVEVDDITKFKLSQKLIVKHHKTFCPWDTHLLINYILSPALYFTSISEIVRNFISNAYGNFNIIFVNNDIEHFSFYTLQKVEKEKKFWKMDCRLEHLTLDLQEPLIAYCCDLFRKIYKACFGTCNYIVDYNLKYSIAEIECGQLFESVIIASNFFKLNLVLKNEVKLNCTYSLTSCDKVDLKTDDKDQLETFKRYTLDQNAKFDIIKRLFDDIDEENLIILSAKF